MSGKVRRRRLATLALACPALSLAAPAVPTAAQPAVRVASIASDRECSIYETFWGGWLVIECRNNFPELRDRLESAIGESGTLALAPRGARAADYVVTGRVGALEVVQSRASAADYCIGGTRVSASLDLRMSDTHSGAVAYAGTITRSYELGSDVVAGAGGCSTMAPSRASYASLQREVALSAARALSFKVRPLRIVAVSGKRITLNYGSPLLPLGMIVQVPDVSGAPIRYRVSGSTPEAAVADAMGDIGDIRVGATAYVIESDDPAANGRRYEKVELP